MTTKTNLKDGRAKEVDPIDLLGLTSPKDLIKSEDTARNIKDKVAKLYIMDAVSKNAQAIYIEFLDTEGITFKVDYKVGEDVFPVTHRNRPDKNEYMNRVSFIDSFKKLVGVETPEDNGKIYEIQARDKVKRELYQAKFKVELSQGEYGERMSLERVLN